MEAEIKEWELENKERAKEGKEPKKTKKKPQRSRSPIILLDEFEKASREDILNVIGKMTDREMNFTFLDKYFNFRLDLSQCQILLTANYLDKVPQFVKDRGMPVNIELLTYQQRKDRLPIRSRRRPLPPQRKAAARLLRYTWRFSTLDCHKANRPFYSFTRPLTVEAEAISVDFPCCLFRVFCCCRRRECCSSERIGLC